MPKFFVPSASIVQDKIVISDRNQVHHIKHVLRLKVSDQIQIGDDRAKVYHCIIEKLEPQVIVRIIEVTKPADAGNKVNLTIACAIPKNSNLDDIIDKLTQLGVERIIPLKTQCVVVRFDEKKKKARLARWKKIAQNASQQSQRDTLPIIESVRSLKDVLREPQEYDLKLIPTLPGERKTLKEALLGNKARYVLVLIGPEGDFTDDEIELAKESGCLPVSLGPTVLRVETAAVAAASFIKLYGQCA